MKAEIEVDVTSPVKMIGAVSNVARVILEAVVARTEWNTESSSFPGARTDPGGPKFCVYDVH